MFALADHGADVNRALPIMRMTPLMMAGGFGDEEIVRGLLARGANPRLVTLNGLTALDFALGGQASS